MNTCKICKNSANNQAMTVREMLFGTREEFEYFKCSNCGCLQIAEIPQDMARHYDSEKYYAYHAHKKYSRLRNLLHKFVFRAFKLGLLPSSIRYLRYFPALDVIKKLHNHAAILDVGCGDGMLIHEMSVWGFNNLTGIDPFVEEKRAKRVKILKQDVFEHDGQYDCIMMHHSLEHMDRQHAIFEQLHRLLKPKGALLIRIPLADCYAMRKYGANSFQIDAPRHFFIHTIKSMAYLAHSNKFVVDKVQYDSTFLRQFIYNEKYCMDIPYCDYKGKIRIPKKRERLLKKQTKMLNATHDGDQACFILKKQ